MVVGIPDYDEKEVHESLRFGENFINNFRKRFIDALEWHNKHIEINNILGWTSTLKFQSNSKRGQQ